MNRIRMIGAYLEGTCNSIEAALEHFELDMEIENVEEALLDIGLERWWRWWRWMESHELVNEDLEVVGCDQCRTSKRRQQND